jgi:LEA14-like dessication related protein
MAARKILGLLIIFLCLFTAGMIWWGKSGKKVLKKELVSFAPDVEFKSLYISDIDNNSVTIIGDALIKNNFPSTLVIDSLDYDLYIDSVSVLHSGHFKEISIARDGSERVAIPMHLDVKRLRSLIRKNEKYKRDSASYTVKGDYKMKIPIAGMRKFKIDETRIEPAIREIYVKAGKMKFDKMGLKNTEMSMPVIVENHNNFPIKLKNGRYTLEIEHGIEMHGKTQKIVDIPPRGTETIDMEIDTKTAKLPKLGWKLLFREHRTHYKMNFHGIVMSDSEIMRNATLHVSDRGTLAELKQLTKKLKD